MFSGERLRFYRQRIGKTQEALARELGITSAYLSNIENGKRTPSHKVMEAITQSLSIDVKDLWENDGTLPSLPISAEERGIVLEIGDGAGRIRCILPPTQESYLFISRQIAEKKKETDSRLQEVIDFWEQADEKDKDHILAYMRKTTS